MPTLEDKIAEVFGPVAIDKRRLPMSQLQKKGIPAYVAEWVLDSKVPGRGLLSKDEAKDVQEWADKFIPTPRDQNVIKHRLLNSEPVKVLTHLAVEIDLQIRNGPQRIGKLPLLGIDKAAIPDSIIENNKSLLREGMWGVAELQLTPTGVAVVAFRPMQADVSLNLYREARRQFSVEEWHALMLQSMGYNPEAFTPDQQTLLLCRLLPLIQHNMVLAELAPKGTGKSYIYENISPRVRLVSSSISPAVLFVNNASGQWGLLARFAVVVLDEIQNLRFTDAPAIISGLKSYLANGTITRGGQNQVRSTCGLVLLANITLDEDQRPIFDPIVKELPDFLQETAFLDRLRGIIPGWELPKLSSKSLAHGMGLKADFFGDVMLSLREDISADQYVARRVVMSGNSIYRRNEEALQSIASGMMKILFPHGEVSDEEFCRFCLHPAKKLRQIVWNQMRQLDGEYRQYDSQLSYGLT
jgi:ATP-dependent Lon protease